MCTYVLMREYMHICTCTYMSILIIYKTSFCKSCHAIFHASGDC